jgi:hypothetical protein
MGIYQKMPVPVHAILWDTANTDEVIEWAKSFGHDVSVVYEDFGHDVQAGDPRPRRGISFDSLEGTHKVFTPAYIIIGVKGEIYFNRQDIFEATYRRLV